jgi:hypothetical protein
MAKKTENAFMRRLRERKGRRAETLLRCGCR